MFLNFGYAVINRFILFCLLSAIVSCASSGKKNSTNSAQQVERLQNNTEYSAVESEWNELYQ